MVVTDTITVPPSGWSWSPLRDAIGPAWVRLTNGRLNPWRVDASLRTPRSVLDDPCDVAQRRIRRRRVVGCRSGAERAVRLWVPAGRVALVRGGLRSGVVGLERLGAHRCGGDGADPSLGVASGREPGPIHSPAVAARSGDWGRTRRVDGHLAVSIAPVLNLVADPPAGVWGVGAGGRCWGGGGARSPRRDGTVGWASTSPWKAGFGWGRRWC